jgi:peptidoglycan/LPS O-acetylase OafA/YrhL
LGVVLFHYTFRGFAADNYSILPFPNLGGVFKYGFLGVHFFIMISGYIMFFSETHKGIKDFVVSRILRLYPTFWIAVTLTSVITLLIGADRFHVTFIQYAANLTMLNGLIGIDSIDGAWWFMVLVLKFNFIVGFLILLRLTKYQEYFAVVWLLLAVVIIIFNLSILGTFLMPEYAPFFVAGIIFQSAKTKGWNSYKYIIILLSLFFSLYLGGLSINDLQQHYHHSFSIFVISSLIIVFYLAFYLMTIRKRPITLPKAFILYGVATYPLYLIHQNIGYMIFNSLGEWFNKYLILSLTVIVMSLASFVITKYIEPFINDKLRRTIEAIIFFTENIFRKKFV